MLSIEKKKTMKYRSDWNYNFRVDAIANKIKITTDLFVYGLKRCAPLPFTIAHAIKITPRVGKEEEEESREGTRGQWFVSGTVRHFSPATDFSYRPAEGRSLLRACFIFMIVLAAQLQLRASDETAEKDHRENDSVNKDIKRSLYWYRSDNANEWKQRWILNRVYWNNKFTFVKKKIAIRIDVWQFAIL